MGEYKFLDDLAKFGNNTMSAMGGFQKQTSKWISEHTTNLIKNMDLVSRKELEERLEALEARLAGKKPTKKSEE